MCAVSSMVIWCIRPYIFTWGLGTPFVRTFCLYQIKKSKQCVRHSLFSELFFTNLLHSNLYPCIVILQIYTTTHTHSQILNRSTRQCYGRRCLLMLTMADMFLFIINKPFHHTFVYISNTNYNHFLLLYTARMVYVRFTLWMVGYGGGALPPTSSYMICT